MQVHIARSSGVEPGEAWWSTLGDDELVMFVSSAGVTARGATALARAWASFIDAGVWRYQSPLPGDDVTATYRQAHLPPGVHLRFVEGPVGHYDVALSADQYAAASVAAIQRCVNDSIGHGWTYHRTVQVRIVRTRRAS